MINHLSEYEIDCPECKASVKLYAKDIGDLMDDIDDDIAEARKDERVDVEREFDGMVDPDDLPIQPRTIHDLSAAIERGDKVEARILLDRIADDLSLEHQEAVQNGRYSSRGIVG